jgi:hypothetical protein
VEEQPTGVAEALELVIKDPPTHQEIAELAYVLWQDRGSPEGSPEVDWLNAVEKLESRHEP